MNRKTALLFPFFLGTILISSCDSKQQRRIVAANSPFEITNTILEDGSVSWIIRATNGLSVELEKNNLTIYYQIDNTLTTWFDPHTGKLLKILLETPNTPNEAGQWITDFNADGLPDKRRIKGKEGFQVFYRGQWYEAQPGDSTNSVITVDKDKISIFFNSNRWEEVSRGH